jgi:drug/metabolite transporter (DMT)-like permease
VVSLAILDALGNIFLVRSLENVDLSIFGPLNAYKPVIAIILSVFLIGEVPTLMGILGIFVIIAGSYLLGKEGDKNHHESFLKLLKSRGIGYRFLSIVFTSVAAVISKKVILLSDPLTTISYWSVLGLPVVITYYLWARKRGYYKNLIWNGKQVILTGGLLFSFLLLQITSLYTFKFIQVGYSLALFQLSAVISLFFGMKIFQEKNIRYRLSGTLVMITGAVIIILFG